MMTEKNAERVCVLVMNPQNGEIYAMVDAPEYNLNKPFELVEYAKTQENPESDGNDELKDDADEEEDTESGNMSVTAISQMDKLNNMWRNYLISDTYEPGSTAKIVTLTAALETGSVNKNNTFFLPRIQNC